MPPYPILDAEAMQYGIDISQDDAEISKQIEEKLQAYYNEKSSYKVIFIGIPKNYMLKVNSSLAALTIKAAEKINADNIIIDVRNIDFQNGTITEGMFSSGRVSKKRLSFVFPDDKITTIGQRSFLNLDNIDSLTIPNSVVSIEYMAFQAIYSLKTLVLGSKLEFIGDYAFSYSKIKEIVIPASVTTIGTKPFGDSLTTVTYLGTSPNTIKHNGDVFKSTAKTLILPNVNNPDPNEWKNFLGGNFTEVRQN